MMYAPKALSSAGRRTLAPLHQRVVGRQFEAVINRLNSLLNDVRLVRGELQQIRNMQEELDRRLSVVAAGVWDTTAMSRRLLAIEDRLTGVSGDAPRAAEANESETQT